MGLVFLCLGTVTVALGSTEPMGAKLVGPGPGKAGMLSAFPACSTLAL